MIFNRGFTLLELIVVVAILTILFTTMFELSSKTKSPEEVTQEVTEKVVVVDTVGKPHLVGPAVTKDEIALLKLVRDCDQDGRTIFVANGMEYEYHCSIIGKRPVKND